MDEDKIQAERRENDENATRQRAAILGVQYVDTRSFEKDMPLVNDVLAIDAMYKGRLVPLKAQSDDSPFVFGITTQTPQSLVKTMERDYSERGDSLQFVMISNSGFKALMNRYDPPKEIIYDDDF